MKPGDYVKATGPSALEELLPCGIVDVVQKFTEKTVERVRVVHKNGVVKWHKITDLKLVDPGVESERQN